METGSPLTVLKKIRWSLANRRLTLEIRFLENAARCEEPSLVLRPKP